MHDTTKDQDTKEEINNKITEYFDLNDLDLTDLDKKISELTFDEEK